MEQLNVNSPQRIAWNPKNKKEVDEAKQRYIVARRAGKLIRNPEGEAIEKWTDAKDEFTIDEPLQEGQFFMRILDKSGDRRIVWNSKDPDQVKEAAKLFKEFAAKGWRAYAIGADGKQGKRIREFNGDTEEVFFDESQLATKLKDFVKQFPTVEMGAKTRPA